MSESADLDGDVGFHVANASKKGPLPTFDGEDRVLLGCEPGWPILIPAADMGYPLARIIPIDLPDAFDAMFAHGTAFR